MRRIFTLVFLAVLFAVWGEVCASSSMAPSFRASKLIGEKTEVQFDPKQLQRPTLLVFWASWCVSCRHETPDLIELYRKKNKSLDILGISVDQRAERGAAFVREANIPYLNLHDPQAKVAALFRVQATPSLILIDKTGTIRFQGSHLGKEFTAALQEVSGS